MSAFFLISIRLQQMTPLVITTSASQPTISRPSWRSTSGTWAARDVAAEDPVEDEVPVGADLPDRLVSAGLIRWVESLFVGELDCMGF